MRNLLLPFELRD